ncbi:unnamed protein product [Lupinus luteus]|uniref:Uncharacterized protein n=1 Tax=Lupinus luteus TaxID=3873 RepID=A0AAV1VVP5_LUPLU
MNSSMGGANGSSDGDFHNSMMGNHPSYQRLSLTQKAALERFMIDYPHPTERQRHQLAAEIGLEPKQIKFWVQNKRMQIKNQNERADNKALRIENSRIQNENQLIRDTMINILCPACRGLACREEEHAQFNQRMRLENERLRAQCARVSGLLQRYLEKQISQQELQALLNATMGSSSQAPMVGSSVNQVVPELPNNNVNFGPQIMHQEMLLPNQMMSSNTADMENRMMVEVGNAAMDELVKLMHINEPIWINSSLGNGKLILNREDYEKTFLRARHFNVPTVHVESSKSSTVVNMGPMKLIDMFLDSEKWANLFPTIVTKAEIVHVVQPGLLYNRSGALQLMYEKMHTLSHLVPSREFCFLRYCQQVGVDEWVICDVSYDIFGDNNNPISGCWRHPSGCMIQDMHNGCSMVTWIEHVEVDDRTQTHLLYKDLVSSSFAYGSERWIVELRRMCERFSLYCIERIPNQEVGGVINSMKGRRCIMNISQRMVKIFCENLTIPYNLDMQNITGEENSEVKISIRKCTELGQPHGMVVVAITSLWVPLPYQQVFEFLTDDNKRHQWDVLSDSTPVQRIVQISNGTHPSNYTSIIQQPFAPTENNMLILQESFTDPTGSYVVYAPVDVASLDMALNDEESTMVAILPSGFVITGDGKSNTGFGGMNNTGVEGSRGGAEGSLLTVALQILVCSLSDIARLDMRSVSKVNTILTSIVANVKNALSINNAE